MSGLLGYIALALSIVSVVVTFVIDRRVARRLAEERERERSENAPTAQGRYRA